MVTAKTDIFMVIFRLWESHLARVICLGTTESRTAVMRHAQDTFIGLSTWKYKLIFFLRSQFATRLLYQAACRFQNIQLDANNNNTITHHRQQHHQRHQHRNIINVMVNNGRGGGCKRQKQRWWFTRILEYKGCKIQWQRGHPKLSRREDAKSKNKERKQNLGTPRKKQRRAASRDEDDENVPVQSARKEHADDAEGIIITTETGGEPLTLTELS